MLRANRLDLGGLPPARSLRLPKQGICAGAAQGARETTYRKDGGLWRKLEFPKKPSLAPPPIHTFNRREGEGPFLLNPIYETLGFLNSLFELFE